MNVLTGLKLQVSGCQVLSDALNAIKVDALLK